MNASITYWRKLLGLFFAVGIAALITVPSALAIIVCLMLSGARQSIKEPGQTRVA